MSMVIWIQRHSLLEPFDGRDYLHLPLPRSFLRQLLGRLFGARIDHMSFELFRVRNEHFVEECLELPQSDLRDVLNLNLLPGELVAVPDNLVPEYLRFLFQCFGLLGFADDEGRLVIFEFFFGHCADFLDEKCSDKMVTVFLEFMGGFDVGLDQEGYPEHPPVVIGETRHNVP